MVTETIGSNKATFTYHILKEHYIEQFYIWAVTCDFQQCGILNILDSDEPVKPPVMLRNSKWCSVSSLSLIDY